MQINQIKKLFILYCSPVNTAFFLNFSYKAIILLELLSVLFNLNLALFCFKLEIHEEMCWDIEVKGSLNGYKKNALFNERP